METEKWITIEGWDKLYEISDLGNFKVNGKVKYPYSIKGGPYFHLLYLDRKPVRQYLHRLVAKAFVPRKAGQDIVIQKDGNVRNCNHENLCWKELAPGSKSNSKLPRRIYQFDTDDKLVQTWKSMYEIQAWLGYRQPNISACVAGKKALAYGFKWKVYDSLTPKQKEQC